MRFRFGLPVLQLVATILLAWAPWVPGAHEFDVVLRDGREFKGWTILPNEEAFDAAAWAQSVNLPTILFEIPADLAIDAIAKEPTIPDPRMRFTLFSVLGLICWYFVGRLVEDVLQFHETRILPRMKGSDLAFAVDGALVSAIAVVVSIFGHPFVPVLAYWACAWFIVTFGALSIRLAQYVQYRKATPSF